MNKRQIAREWLYFVVFLAMGFLLPLVVYVAALTFVDQPALPESTFSDMEIEKAEPGLVTATQTVYAVGKTTRWDFLASLGSFYFSSVGLTFLLFPYLAFQFLRATIWALGTISRTE